MIDERTYGTTTWIDLVDPTPEDLVDLDLRYGVGERTFDEARRRAARPTLQRHGDHAYLVAFSGTLAEVDMFVGDGWFVTVRHHDDEGREWGLERVQEFLARTDDHVDQGNLLARVVDDLVDGYFDATDVLEDRLEAIEERIFDESVPSEQQMQADLFAVRRELVRLRRAVIPLRDVIAALLRREVQWVDGDALVILRDTFDKLLRSVDLVDDLRELVGNAVDAHLAVVSNQMNLVMKQLTAWGSIVFGATLIAGIYGMNFEHMPELDWYYGYLFALGLMLLLSFGLYRVFRRRHWL